MKEYLQNIEQWLSANAYKIIESSLQPPASELQLLELEAELGKALPNDFKQLYLWKNGLTDDENLGSLFYGMDFYPLDRVRQEFDRRRESDGNSNFELLTVDKEIDPSNMYNSDWLQLGFDGSHTGLFLDLAPSIDGQYGQVIFIDDEYRVGILVASTIRELVAHFSNDLVNGLYRLDDDALDEENHYLVPDGKISLVNWKNSERWARS